MTFDDYILKQDHILIQGFEIEYDYAIFADEYRLKYEKRLFNLDLHELNFDWNETFISYLKYDIDTDSLVKRNES